jgi:hypothetical protein
VGGGLAGASGAACGAGTTSTCSAGAGVSGAVPAGAGGDGTSTTPTIGGAIAGGAGAATGSVATRCGVRVVSCVSGGGETGTGAAARGATGAARMRRRGWWAVEGVGVGLSVGVAGGECEGVDGAPTWRAVTPTAVLRSR